MYRRQCEDVQSLRVVTLIALLKELFPFVTFQNHFFCPGHNSKCIVARTMKLHTCREYNMRMYNPQLTVARIVSCESFKDRIVNYHTSIENKEKMQSSRASKFV